MDPDTSLIGMPSVEAGTKRILRGNGLKIIALDLVEKNSFRDFNFNFIFAGEMLDTVISTQKRSIKIV